jgi:pimeloyl-ACP methyl ester carboxylesterase
MKNLLKWLGIILVILTAVILLGPRPAVSKLDATLPLLNQNLAALEREIRTLEASGRVKPDNEARIVWYDSLRKEKTPYSIVYLHGFGASQAEGAPVHTDLARRFGCNLYLARLQDHGIKGGEAFAELTPENYLETAKQAVSIGKLLGDSVIVIGTSTGGAFALYLAAHNPDIKSVIVYSPLIDFYSQAAVLLDKPWGLQLSRMVNGSDYVQYNRGDSLQERYWLSKYRVEGLVTLASFIHQTMTPETFARVKCPVFLGYYYKNEEEQDNIVSVPAMRRMYEQLGTPEQYKRQVAFPDAGHHVIASYIRSRDWQGVRDETALYLEEVLGLAPAQMEMPKELIPVLSE